MRQRVFEAGQTDGAHTGQTHVVWGVGVGRKVGNIKRPSYGAVRARLVDPLLARIILRRPVGATIVAGIASIPFRKRA